VDGATCDFCGARSSLTDLFRTWPLTLRRRGLICPHCRSVSKKPRTPAWVKPLLAAVVFGAGMLAGGPALGGEWLAGALILPVLVTVAHESTHALAGWLTGARVFEVRVGWREPRFQFRLGRTRFTVARGLLRGGYCVATFLRPVVARWRYAVLYGLPMALHAGALAAVWPWLTLPRSPDGIRLVHFFALWNAVYLLASARPFDYVVGAFRIPSDGKALVLLATLPAQAEVWRRQGFVLPAVYALLDGSKEEALARAREVEHLFPDEAAVERALFAVYWALGQHAYALRFVGAYVRGVRQPDLDERQLLALGAMQGARFERWLYCVVCLHGGAWEAALTAIGEELARETLAEGRAMWQALKAYVLLLRGGPDDREAARAAAQEAFDLLPWVSFVCGTEAATLIETGHPAEGLRRLDQADSLDRTDQEQAARNAWRAIGCARLGRKRQARRCFRAAEARGLEVGPPPELLRRAAAAVD